MTSKLLGTEGVKKHVQGHDWAHSGPLKLGRNRQQIAVARHQYLRFASHCQVHEGQIQHIPAIRYRRKWLRYAHSFDIWQVVCQQLVLFRMGQSKLGVCPSISCHNTMSAAASCRSISKSAGALIQTTAVCDTELTS